MPKRQWSKWCSARDWQGSIDDLRRLDLSDWRVAKFLFSPPPAGWLVIEVRTEDVIDIDPQRPERPALIHRYKSDGRDVRAALRRAQNDARRKLVRAEPPAQSLEIPPGVQQAKSVFFKRGTVVYNGTREGACDYLGVHR
jgi:hypothetical protein